MIATTARLGARIAILSLVVLGGSGCGGGNSSGGGRPQGGGTVTVAGPIDLQQLNSLVAAERYNQEINRYALFLPLIEYDAALDFAPRLAASWESLGDTGVVMRLRRDVHWHDGQRTTAADVVFTFRRAMDPASAFPNAGYFRNWTAVEAVDSFAVRFLYTPHADPLAGLPFTPIMPAHLLDSVPPERMRQAAFNRQPVGNGPFRFVEYRANDRLVLEANPDFPAGLGGRPHIDRLVWRVIPEPTAQLAALQTGAVDLILSPRSEHVRELDADPRLRSIIRPARQYAFIGWNGRRKPLDDARVRRALTMAINREQIVQALRAGYGELAVGPVGSYHWSFDQQLMPLPFSRDSARALLREAGFEDRNGDGILQDRAGVPLAIEFIMPPDPFNRDLAELVRNDLAAIGVRAATRPTEGATLIATITAADRKFDAVLLAWESDFRLNLRDTFHSDGVERGAFQLAGYSNAEVDALIDASSVEPDRERARPMLTRLQQILREEQPWSFLYSYPDTYLAAERVRDLEMDIRGAFVNVQRWWIPGVEQVPPAAADDSAAGSRSPVPAPAG
jgi:peptide/nickel transport system substrate-binding protein